MLSHIEEYNVHEALSSTSLVSNMDCGQYTIFVLCTTVKDIYKQ